jgi:hypothetical protein
MIDGLNWLFNNPYSYIVIPVAIEQKNDFVKDIVLPLVPSILTIVGWLIVSKQQETARAEQQRLVNEDRAEQQRLVNEDRAEQQRLVNEDRNRADKTERISSILNQITDIKELSFTYYQLDANDTNAIELGLIIPARIQQLNHFINRACCQNQVLPEPIRKKFIKFRRALTGGTFGSVQRISLPITDNLYQKIIRAELDLYIEVEKLLP